MLIDSDENATHVTTHFLEIMCRLLTECKVISLELLNIILLYLLNSDRVINKYACLLAKDLFQKCLNSLEPSINLVSICVLDNKYMKFILFSNILFQYFRSFILVNNNKNILTMGTNIYKLIMKMKKMCPSLLLDIFSQLDYKLKSSIEEERYDIVSLLAEMFSKDDSSVLVHKYISLWKIFMDRFKDESARIREKCVKCATALLCNLPDFRENVIDELYARCFDDDENVRSSAIMTIIKIAQFNLHFFINNEEVLMYIVKQNININKVK